MIGSLPLQFGLPLKRDSRSSTKKRSCKTDRESMTQNFTKSFSQLKKVAKTPTLKSSILKIEQKILENIDFVCRRTLRLYEQNLEYYKLNVGKLNRAIQNEIKQKNLKYDEKILLFLKNRNIEQLRFGLSNRKLQSQLEILNQFLTELYEKKKIQEIKILKESFKDEQTLIANQIDLQKLVNLHQSTVFKQTNTNVDFVSQYQSICRKFGAVQPNLKAHIGIRKHLNYCQKDIVDHFEQLRKFKTQGMSSKIKRF